MNVAHEIELLQTEMKRLGSKNSDGNIQVNFGVLFNDDRCANVFEALVGTGSKRVTLIEEIYDIFLYKLTRDFFSFSELQNVRRSFHSKVRCCFKAFTIMFPSFYFKNR